MSAPMHPRTTTVSGRDLRRRTKSNSATPAVASRHTTSHTPFASTSNTRTAPSDITWPPPSELTASSPSVSEAKIRRARRPICSASRSGCSSTNWIAMRVLSRLRSTSGKLGSAHPSWSAQRNSPFAPGKRSRHSVSPVFVDVGTKASICRALRIVHGIDIATTTASGIAAARRLRRHPARATSAAARTATTNRIENGRISTDTPSAAPNATSRRVDGSPVAQSWVTTIATAARHQKTYIVSSCTLAVWKIRFGKTARMPAPRRPPSSPNSRRPIR